MRTSTSARSSLALLAAGVGAVLPVTVGQATPSEQSARTISQNQQKTERSAVPTNQTSRAAFGIQMMGGGFGYWRSPSRGPWDAPRYNQRKARRDARRVNERPA